MLPGPWPPLPIWQQDALLGLQKERRRTPWASEGAQAPCCAPGQSRPPALLASRGSPMLCLEAEEAPCCACRQSRPPACGPQRYRERRRVGLAHGTQRYRERHQDGLAHGPQRYRERHQDGRAHGPQRYRERHQVGRAHEPWRSRERHQDGLVPWAPEI